MFVEGERKQFVLAVARLCEGAVAAAITRSRPSRILPLLSTRKPTVTGRILTGKEVDPLRGAVLEDSKSLLRERRHVGRPCQSLTVTCATTSSARDEKTGVCAAANWSWTPSLVETSPDNGSWESDHEPVET